MEGGREDLRQLVSFLPVLALNGSSIQNVSHLHFFVVTSHLPRPEHGRSHTGREDSCEGLSHRTHTHTQVHMHTHHTHMHMHTCMRMYTYSATHMHIHTHAHAHRHAVAHTHAHTHAPFIST